MSRLDWKYLYLLVSFSIGFLAGYQGLHNRFKKDSWSALFTLHGLLYILSRGLVPALIFTILYASSLIRSNPFLWSLFLGTGFEGFLRSTFYIKEEQKDGGSIDVFKGPFEILHWYQNLMLEETATSLAASRKRFIKTKLPKGVTFLRLADRVLDNLNAYPKDQEATIRAIDTEVRKLLERFHELNETDWQSAPKIDLQYCEKLAYLVLNLAGKRGFNTLLSDE